MVSRTKYLYCIVFRYIKWHVWQYLVFVGQHFLHGKTLPDSGAVVTLDDMHGHVKNYTIADANVTSVKWVIWGTNLNYIHLSKLLFASIVRDVNWVVGCMNGESGVRGFQEVSRTMKETPDPKEVCDWSAMYDDKN